MSKTRVTYSNGKRTDPSTSNTTQLELERLLWALLLFLVVFVGKQIYPDKMLAVGQDVLSVLRYSTDMESVFSDLGASLTEPGSFLEGVEAFCVEVFGPKHSEPTMNAAIPQLELPTKKAGLLHQQSDHTPIFSDILPEKSEPISPEPIAAEETILEAPTVPAVGTVLTVVDDSGQKVPDGYTFNELSFGALERVTPVLGYLNSGFGYRDHPMNGKYLFHGGVDISAKAGDCIGAFADGTVDYIGEDKSYGLYLQLDHGNGIKSFYAHCQKLCVQKGQQVSAGDTVALVGATGSATGPHLHLELKCDNLRVDPAYYLDFLSYT